MKFCNVVVQFNNEKHPLSHLYAVMQFQAVFSFNQSNFEFSNLNRHIYSSRNVIPKNNIECME